MLHRIVTAAIVVAASLPTPAHAQQTAAPPPSATSAERADSWEESLGAGATYLDQQLVALIKATGPAQRVVPGLALRLGYNLGTSWNFSIGTFAGTAGAVTVLQPFADVGWTPNVDWKASPFVTLGAGFTNVDWNGYLARSDVGVHLGAGLKAMIASRLALRLEVREQYEKFSDSAAFPNAVYNGTATLGLSFYTHGNRAAVASVAVNPPGPSLQAIGATIQLAAVPRDRAGRPLSGRSVRWSSGNDSIVTVSEEGLATAVTNGMATISAAVEGATGTATVTVAQAPTALAVNPTLDTLTALGQTLQLAASAQDTNGHAIIGPQVEWASSNPAAATVSATGVVTALRNDTATITATSGGRSGSASITVRQAVAAVSVSPLAATLSMQGDTVRFGAQATDANGRPVTGRAITWSDTTPGVATLGPGGLVRAVGSGMAVIVATVDGVSGAATLKVDLSAAVIAAPVAAPVAPAPAPVVLALPTVGSAALVLKSVNFRPNSSVLPPEARAELDAVAQAIRSLATARWQIAGYTSSTGNAARNQLLSRRRAMAVRAYLIRQGIPASRLVAVGYGPRDPIASNRTVAGRRANMRVEFKRLR